MRLTRAEQQQRTRAAVLAAAAAEFASCGYAGAKVDRIAERASLTRGAVYSNFAGKRALYLAVLMADVSGAAAGGPPPTDARPVALGPVAPAEARPPAPAEARPLAPAEAAEAFARVWLERLPLTADTSAGGRLRARSLVGVFDHEPGRAALASVLRLEALLLGAALERSSAKGGRQVRRAELLLTLLHGANDLAQAAPGFGDPFDVARACRHLAALDLADSWNPPHLPFVSPAETRDDPWEPPRDLVDELTGDPVTLPDDGVVVLLGVDRLGAAEEALRAAAAPVSVVVVTVDPAETGALVRLRVADLTACLRRAFGPGYRPPLRLVLDDRDAFGTGGHRDTEIGLRLRGGRVVARSRGRGAGHAVAS